MRRHKATAIGAFRHGLGDCGIEGLDVDCQRNKGPLPSSVLVQVTYKGETYSVNVYASREGKRIGYIVKCSYFPGRKAVERAALAACELYVYNPIITRTQFWTLDYLSKPLTFERREPSERTLNALYRLGLVTYELDADVKNLRRYYLTADGRRVLKG